MAVSASTPGPAPIRLRPGAQLDSPGTGAARHAFERCAADADRDVVLDLGGVAVLDGAGVGAIAFLHKRLAARGLRLTVDGISGQPLALLQDLGIAGLLDAHATTDNKDAA
jgi:anti-anti-sigma regulatory factor